MALANVGARSPARDPELRLGELLGQHALDDLANYHDAERFLAVLKDARERVNELRIVLLAGRYLGLRAALDEVRDQLSADINLLVGLLDAFDETCRSEVA